MVPKVPADANIFRENNVNRDLLHLDKEAAPVGQ